MPPLTTTVNLPSSRMYTPTTRELTGEQLCDEVCPHTPTNQCWGVAFVDKAPARPLRFKQIVIQPLRVFRNARRAIKFEQQLRKTPEYKRKHIIRFKMGAWNVLPVPSWMTNPEEHLKYSRECIALLIDEDKKTTDAARNLMKRRRLQSTDALREADEKYVKPLYDGQTPQQAEPVPPNQQRYFSADEETKLLQPGGEEFVLPPEGEERVQPESDKPDDILDERYLFGLMWVLPFVQNIEVHDFVAFAWLGAYQTEPEVEDAQKKIRDACPEWSVDRFEIGDPLELPMPTWLMQLDSKLVYDQPFLKDLLMPSPDYKSPEEVNAQMDAHERAKAADREYKGDLDSVFPVPGVDATVEFVHGDSDDDNDNDSDGEATDEKDPRVLVSRTDEWSKNNKFGLDVRQYIVPTEATGLTIEEVDDTDEKQDGVGADVHVSANGAIRISPLDSGDDRDEKQDGGGADIRVDANGDIRIAPLRSRD